MAKLEGKTACYILRLMNREVEERRKATQDAMLAEELDEDGLLAAAIDYRRARNERAEFEAFIQGQNEEEQA